MAPVRPFVGSAGLTWLARRLVAGCARHAWISASLLILFAAILGIVASRKLEVDADTNRLLAADLPFRIEGAKLDKAFPQFTDLIVVVVNATTPEQGESAARRLSEALSARPELFKSVRWPFGDAFFKTNGLMLLPLESVQKVAQQLVNAQPLLGTLAVDPSLRGLFRVFGLALDGAAAGQYDIGGLKPAFDAVSASLDTLLAGKPVALSWRTLIAAGTAVDSSRQFILVQPVLDYNRLEPGKRASTALREIAVKLDLTPAHGITVRLTGSVPLSDEEFGSVAEGAGWATLITLGIVCLILFAAVRSFRLILAILVTLGAGLAATSGFAALAVGSLNLVSIAFAVLFIGIAVDFGIQFSVRFRHEARGAASLSDALLATADWVGGPLTLAALATAVGFLSFVPTSYKGVSELGLIAGVGMMIALALNMTLLPAMIGILKPAAAGGLRESLWAAPIDAFLLKHRMAIRVIAALIALGAGLIALQMRFDFDPLHLKNPNTESVATLKSLIDNPTTNPYTIEILAPSLAAAGGIAKRLGALPEVGQILSLASFVPTQQPEKLAILSDLGLLLGPALNPKTTPPPDAAAQRASIASLAMKLSQAKPAGDPTLMRLKAAIERLAAGDDPLIARADQLLLGDLGAELTELRQALAAKPVTLADLPADLTRDWVTPDGMARIEISPAGTARNPATLARFVEAVRTIAPDATGDAVAIVESGHTISGAFQNALGIAFVSIGVLLVFILRRPLDVGLVLAPLALAGIITAAISVLIDLQMNFANVIALPLMLGIGVAFNIYLVMNWRAGHGAPLQSATTRAIVFSALTTGTAFGSLALSSHPGTRSMGELLALALAVALATTLLILPALLGPAPVSAPGRNEV